MMHIIVTRPAREAALWVEALQQAGYTAQAVPLIDITPGPDALQLQHWRAAAQTFDAWMFVSPQAVAQYWALPGPPLLTQEFGSFAPRYWAPGPGTAAALHHVGVPAALIDAPSPQAAQFDSEALWAQVQTQVHVGHRLLLVHGVSADGSGGRDWLARQCVARGGSVQRCAAYRRQRPSWTQPQQAAAAGWAQAPACWLLSSSEAVQHLAQLCPQQTWGQARALATHPRIALAAQELGFGQVWQSRPALPDVIQTLKSGGRS